LDSAIEHDVALGPGDEESRGIRRANIVQVAGDAERFGGPLPASFCRIQPSADKYQRKNTRQPKEDYQPISWVNWGNRHARKPSSLNPDVPGKPN
jgi:hypothetical protein